MPAKNILREPNTEFSEHSNQMLEIAAPYGDHKIKAGISTKAGWTKFNRNNVNIEALTLGQEPFEVRHDCVIVLRELSREEAYAYGTVTAKRRGEQ
jgi:hypothetical protein